MTELPELDLILFKTARETFKEDPLSAEKAKEGVANVANIIISATNIVRREGLLALEKYMEELSTTGYEGFARDMIDLIINGTDPEFVREIMVPRLYLLDPHSFDTYLHRIIYDTFLCIQAGVNPRIILEIIVSYVVEEYRDDVRKAFMEKIGWCY